MRRRKTRDNSEDIMFRDIFLIIGGGFVTITMIFALMQEVSGVGIDKYHISVAEAVEILAPIRNCDRSQRNSLTERNVDHRIIWAAIGRFAADDKYPSSLSLSSELGHSAKYVRLDHGIRILSADSLINESDVVSQLLNHGGAFVIGDVGDRSKIYAIEFYPLTEEEIKTLRDNSQIEMKIYPYEHSSWMPKMAEDKVNRAKQHLLSGSYKDLFKEE